MNFNQTFISRGRDGMQATTTFEFPTKRLSKAGRIGILEVRTSKSYNGGIKCYASVMEYDPPAQPGGMSARCSMLGFDFIETKTDQVRCTAKNVEALHNRVLADIEGIKARAIAFYAAKEPSNLTPHDSDYETRVKALEAEGMSRSDAQGVVDAELIQA